ncbi:MULTISPECIES: ribosome silencing factor [unclassified Leptolyngbya]|uniref:ribosome silencing factor n=1 Tax=unclassified Leptolyngbya TaxID=2650499 RepID=UPI0016896C6B|nr:MULTISPECIES: ribosome silencing factor [unclassified Leptolyngbya]MBD1913575.1 ribosome silencing factor [Leptolyngbya sp. FACHB-8]MBD2155854.1 ribosome silencing factor [Leptolyngbya sp. FACHB-16]
MIHQSSFNPTTTPYSASTPSRTGKDVSGEDLALTIARAADDRKAVDTVVLKVSDVSYLADYFVITSGMSLPQVRAIANSIEQEVGDTWQRAPRRVEGQSEGNWIVMDYGDVIVHIFMPKEREYYGLEAFWGHAEHVSFTP